MDFPVKIKSDIHHFFEQPTNFFYQKIYWLNNLSGELPETNLLPDYIRPIKYNKKNQFISFELSEDLAEAIIKVTQGSYFSIYLVLLSALSILLHKYTGNSDVIVGSPTYKKGNGEDSDNKIVPLRFSVSDHLTFKDLLLQVKDTTISAYTHQNYPYKQLVQFLKLPQIENRCSLFDIVVLLKNIHQQKDILFLNNDITISFDVNKDKKLITGKVEYKESIFQDRTIYLMTRSYVNLLEGIFQNLYSNVADINLLKEADKQQLLKLFNDNSKNYPLNRTIHSLFEEQVSQTPNKIVVVCGETQLTYQELNKKANKLARLLRSLGVEKGEFVGIFKDRDTNFLIALIAILKAGGAYIPIDNNYPPNRIKYMLSNSEVRILLTDSVCLDSLTNLLESCPHLRSLISLDVNSKNKLNTKSLEIHIYDSGDFNNLLEENLEEINQGIDPAYMLYTSGSTGLPKGAIVRHDGAINHIYAQFDELELTEDFCFLQSAPSSTDISVWQFLAPLLIGGKAIIVDLETACIPEKLFRVLQEKKITVVELVPAVFNGLLEYISKLSTERRSLSALKWMMVVGEPVSVKRVNQWLSIYPSIRVANAYGPTEAADDITQFIVEKPFPDNQRTVPIGKPLANLNLYILDYQMQLVPIGVPGEICVSGIGVGNGYWKNEEKTRSCFVPNPYPDTRKNLPESNRDLIYKTGDLGRWLPDGNIEFLGRIDGQVKIRGFRIELGEIEAQLGQHPSVLENVVIVREDSSDDKCLVAYVVPKLEDRDLHKNSAINNELVSQLRHFLQERLPQHMIPSAFVLLKSLPIAPSGKVDRRALPAPDWKLQSNGIYVAPSTPIEEILASIWAKVLKLEKVGIHDNFFELGGHSLLATQVISQMRQAFEIELPLRGLFEAPTISKFARHIEKAISAGLGLEAPPIQRISRNGKLTLSFAQQRLWFLSQLEPQNPLYNLSAAIRLQGQLNQSALEQTFNEILRRHEALRTNFETVEGQPVAVISPVIPLPLPLLDFSELPIARRETEVNQLVSEESRHPFDLNTDLLLRVKLLRLGEQEHILLITVHHIASDGWSIGVLVHEMSTLYQACCEEQPSLRLASLTPLPELPIQYADFAAWQRQWLQGEVLASQISYWRKQLEDAPALLELPTDHPRPAVQTFRGATCSFTLSKALSVALNQLSQQAGSTLFMTLLAAFKILLGRYTGSEDIVVGTPIANRNRAEIEGLIGFFVNTLVLRTDLSGNPSFRELLTRVREVALGAYSHQDLPFEQLVEELHPQRALSHTPLFQVMFILQNAPMSEMALSGLNLSFLKSHSGTAQFDLTLSMEETSEGLLGTFEYSTDLFEASTIERIAEHFKTLLAGIITNPDRQLQELPLLSETERHQLLVKWNETEREYSSDQCIHHLFEEQAKRTPDAVAVVFENQQLTYQQLNQRANQLARHLQSLGVKPEVLVGICVERSLELVIGILGILKAGGAYVPIDPTYPQERLTFVLEDTQTSVLLTQQRLVEHLPQHNAHTICLDSDWEAIPPENQENPTPEITAENLAYVIYTSGSTGKPKGVQITHRNLVHSTSARIAYYKESVTSFLLLSSFAFDSSVAGIFWTLCQGGMLYLPLEGVQRDVPKLIELITQHQVSHLLSLPSLYSQLLELAKPEQLTSLRTIIIAGEACPSELVQRHLELQSETSLFNEYGPTEGTVWSSVYHCQDPEVGTPVPIGCPIANTQIYLLDSHLHPVPVGIVGELYISGDGLARGYLNQPEMTTQRFIPNPFNNKSRRVLYKTGDLARYLPDGNIEFIGRIDNQVKIRGFRIELGEIETALNQHPQVRESVVLARDDVPGDKRLVAYIVPNRESIPTIPQLRDLLKERLPEYMVPSVFVLLKEFPLTPNGKLDRRGLPAPEQVRPEFAGVFVAPRSSVEEKLVKIWAELLKIERVGIHDNFFDLGGHSLLVTQVVSRLRDVFEIELPVSDFFEAPTIAELAVIITQRLAEENGSQTKIIPQSRNSRTFPLSFAQQRLWFLDRFEPENPSYNQSAAMRITGLLNVAALERSFNEIVRRHEVFRTTFTVVDGQPVQVIAPNLTLTLPVVDLRELPEAESEVLRLSTEEAQWSFNLAEELLLRCTLIRLGETEHVLICTMHHIISDAWSLGILVRELATLYEAFSSGNPSSLPELPIQYADFAVWQRQWLSGEVLETQLNYWLSQLQGAPDLLQLPTDRPRPSVQTYQGKSHSFSLDTELTRKLQTLSRESGTTLFMTLLAAFATLLHRYSGQEDISIGSPIANRNRKDIESLIGFFVNTLVLRTRFEDNPSIKDLLARVRETTLKAYEYQDVPFEQLVEALQPQRSLSYSPLFQVMFILQNAPMGEVELPGVTLTQIEQEKTTAKFDLTVSMTETAQGLVGEWEYNSDLFDGATIERMTAHFQNLLSAIVINPQQTVAELSLLSEAERHQLLTKWNKTEREYPSDKCIHQLFEEQVKLTPNVIAVVFENQQLTYRQLNQQANQLAHYLLSLEVGSGVRVGISFEPSLDLVVSLLGTLKAGGAYVPLDPNYPPERLAFMLEDANVHVLLTQEYLIEKIPPQNTQLVCLERDRDTITIESVENLDCQTTLDDLAYAIYTSGSTGRPKAVLGTIRGIVNRLHWMWETLPFRADEVCCQKTSINFVDHVAEIFLPLLKGIPLVIVPDNIRGDIPRLMNLLSDKKITRIVVVPSLLKAMLDNEPQQLTILRYLKYVFCSGEALSLKLAEAFHQKLSSARLFNLYGSSEVAADVTCFEVNFWETRQRILQYFKPEVAHDTTENQVLGVHQKPFTQPGVSPEMLATKFQRSELPSYPLTVEDYYDKLSQEVLPYAINTGSPTFIGHMTSALPDFMHDMSKMISQLNQNLVKIETSKSLIFLEREAIAILHRLVYNFSNEFYKENIQQKNRSLGLITTGGTTANISALLCARNSGLLSQENSAQLSKESLYKVLSKKGYHDIVIIGSRLMHYSLNKAASMLGLGTDNIVFIDSNDDGKLDLNLLKEKIRECRRNKLYILALVGIAGTTESGEIDPLFELGDIAQEFGIHFHVDAAWGGATIFSDKHKGKLNGINKADSLTICGHKQLYLPQGISVCLFKDPQMLNFAETTARYQAQRDTFDVGRFTIEGSRSALSLCLHGALHIIGKRGYEFLIDDGIEKAQYFSRLIDLLEPFELIMEPILNIVNYRYIPERLRSKAQQKSLSDNDIQKINQLNIQIQREQFEQGLTFVSKTTLIDTTYGKDKEIVVFRAVLSNPNTTTADLQSVLENQLIIAKQIEARNGSIDTTDAVYKEAIHLQLANNPKADLQEALEDYLKKNTIPIGKPISNTQIYILDKSGNLLPPGVPGELYAGGDGLAQGYLNLPELTQEKFIPNPFAKEVGKSKKAEEERLYRTGDLARWLPDGNIEFLGRIDHQVKIRGFRIELGEIEAVLNTHPQTQQAVVIAREDDTGNKRLVAYLVTRNESLTTNKLREFLLSKLPEYMVPNTFVTLDTLPLTPNGKVDRKALPAQDGEISPEHEYVAPRTPSEEIIANIFASVLGVQNVGIHDNFFELGGHSLLATQVISRLNQTFSTELSLRQIFEKPTVAVLAEAVTDFQLQNTEDEEINHLLVELEGLSSEEVQKLLAEEMHSSRHNK